MKENGKGTKNEIRDNIYEQAKEVYKGDSHENQIEGPLLLELSDDDIDWSEPRTLKILAEASIYDEHLIKIQQRMSELKLPSSMRETIFKAMEKYKPDISQNGYTADGFQIEKNGVYDLVRKEIPPLKYSVEGLFHTGLWILGGRSKGGKSWLMLDIALSISQGSLALDNFKCNQAKVLYLALEDGPRRMQERIFKIRPNILDQKPNDITMDIIHKFPMLADGAIDCIKDIIINQEYKVVIVDVAARIGIGGKSAKSDGYSEAYDQLSPLHDLCEETESTIILVDHLRKQSDDDPFNEMLGSVGKQGVPDGLAVFKRTGGSDSVILHIRSKEISEQTHALDFIGNRFVYAGSGEEKALKDTEQMVLTALREESDFMHLNDIVKAAFENPTSGTYYKVRRAVKSLIESDMVTSRGSGRSKRFAAIARGRFDIQDDDITL